MLCIILIIWLLVIWVGATITGNYKYDCEKIKEEARKRAKKEAHERVLELARAKHPVKRVTNRYTQVNIDKAIIMKGENDDEPYRIRTYRRY